MKLADFCFDLPPELIAQNPSTLRGNDRLMTLDRITGLVGHYSMQDLPNLISSDTLMVFNDSMVRKARVFAKKLHSNALNPIEFMFIRPSKKPATFSVMLKAAKRQHIGDSYSFTDGSVATLIEKTTGQEFGVLQFEKEITEEWFEQNGHIPLPPYIKREDTALDSVRYQNVYAHNIGSIACPTAGLHFTKDMLERLKAKGIEQVYITLHVGLGTFSPVREDNVEEHKMHTEHYIITPDVACKINTAHKAGRPILCVGTTSCRTLEAATDSSGVVHSGASDTDIFIYPGYKFRIVDRLFTNFHTPESTLLMLVSAFAGREHILSAYKEAVKQKYKFFSYGDAMLI